MPGLLDAVRNNDRITYNDVIGTFVYQVSLFYVRYI